MFNKPAISMRELELETAELLPSRETLCVSRMQWFPHRRFFGGEPFGFGGGWGGGFGVDSFGFGGEPFGFGGCGGEGFGIDTFGFGGEPFGFGGCGC